MDNDGHQPENVPGKFCPCGLQIFRSSPLVHDPARQIWWWWPSTDPAPKPVVTAVVRVGDRPGMRRWERHPDQDSWHQSGSLVDYFTISPIRRPWSSVGRCASQREHPVLWTRQLPSRIWVAGPDAAEVTS
jgi:hypothetical protein